MTTVLTTGLGAPDLALVRRDPVLGRFLPLVLSTDALADVLGTEVRIDRVRYKHARSAVAAWTSDGPTPFGRHGLVVVQSDPAKAAKSVEAARRTEVAARVLPGTHDRVVVTGAVADRVLSRTTARLQQRRPTLLSGGRLVRHNPLRRQVWQVSDGGDAGSDGTAALRIGTTHVARRHRALHDLRDAGVPVVVPTSAPTARSELLPWWGEGDLASLTDDGDPRGAAGAAGRALLALHRAPSPPTVPTGWTTGGATGLDSVTRLAAVLAPESADRVARLVHEVGARLHRTDHEDAPAHGTVVHGDFSADQVLVDRSGDVRLVDLDRLHQGPAERDLGSFAAARHLDGGPALSALLHGYAEAGGRWDDRALATWTAHGLLSRLGEPFRRRESDWRARWDNVLDAVEGELS